MISIVHTRLWYIIIYCTGLVHTCQGTSRLAVPIIYLGTKRDMETQQRSDAIELYADIVQLNDITDDEAIKELIAICVDFLVDGTNADFQEKLTIFGSNRAMSINFLKAIVRSLLLLLQESMKDGVTLVELEKKCNVYNILPRLTSLILDVWSRRSKQIVHNLIARTVTSNELVDLDWTFGVTASTDDCDQIGKTFLHLKLTLNTSSGIKVIFLELSLDQFYNLLGKLSKCKAHIDFLLNNNF